MPKSLLLVAEDDESARSALVEALEHKGYGVVAVGHGTDALKRIREERERPDLILLDLQMPVLSGWEFLALRRRDPVLLLIPVVVVSGESTIPPDVSPELFLRKPFSLASLYALIDRVLAWSTPEPERAPRASEPWGHDAGDERIVLNSYGQAVVYAASGREARRIVAAINGTFRISTGALEQGIIDRGLSCLYELDRYDTDEEYRNRVGGDADFERIRASRRALAEQWGLETIARPPG